MNFPAFDLDLEIAAIDRDLDRALETDFLALAARALDRELAAIVPELNRELAAIVPELNRELAAIVPELYRELAALGIDLDPYA